MRLGIDLGGTKIAAVVLADDGRAVWDARVATPRDDYDGTIEAIAGLVHAGERAAGTACTVGIGMPGAISPATGARQERELHVAERARPADRSGEAPRA